MSYFRQMIFFLVGVCVLSKQGFASVQPDQNFTIWLEQTMKQKHVPGVSIAVIKNDHIEWAQGFGVVDTQTRQAVTTNTLFEAGSISKPVTAMAALKTVQTNKLQLDKNINDYLISWQVPYNQFTKTEKVTLRRLLDHSAGITVHGFAGYQRGTSLPTLLEVLNGVSPANSAPIRVAAVPGSKFQYSGGGYTIIQQVLIDTYHQPFPELMNQLVLQPLGMKQSTFEQPLPASLLPLIAQPYTPGGVLPGGPHTYVAEAAAGLWSTPLDLAKFVISIQESIHGVNNEVLSPSFAKLMVSPAINNEMGLGLEIGVNKYGKNAEQGSYFMHMGEDDGYQSVIIGDTKSGNGLVVMMNMFPDLNLILQHKTADDTSLIYAIIQHVADEEKWQ